MAVLVAVLAGITVVVFDPLHSTSYPRQSVRLPANIAGMSARGPVTDAMSDPRNRAFIDKSGLTEYITGLYDDPTTGRLKFSLRAYRIPANRGHDPKAVLESEFSGDRNRKIFDAPTTFPAGPLGGLLECYRIKPGSGAVCRWAAGEVVGVALFASDGLQRNAETTRQMRAAVQH